MKTLFSLILLLQLQAIAQTPLPRATPESQGVSSADITAFLTAASASKDEFHSVMLLRHGHVVAEGWWSPYAANLKHSLYSVSKSFTSTAVGLAVAEGRLSVNDKVVSFFKDDLPANVSPHLAAMTVKDLLTMTEGQDPDPTGPVTTGDSNWVRGFLALPVVNTPGTSFLYNTLGVYMLSAIVQKVTGEKIIDYLRPRLFEPLGIKGEDWEISPQDINTGGWGLRLTTEDMARFGQLYLQKGRWNGRQVLPASWVADAVTSFNDQGPGWARSTPRDSSDWLQGYGYLFWRCRHGAYRADGAMGQYIIVLPDQDAVVAITCETADMQDEINLVWRYLLPSLHEGVLPENPAAAAALHSALTSLALPKPAHTVDPALAAGLKGETFHFASNKTDLTDLSFSFDHGKCVLSWRTDRGVQDLPFGSGYWQNGHTTRRGRFLMAKAPASLTGLPDFATAGSYTWIDDHTLRLVLRYTESPYWEILTCVFVQGGVSLTIANGLDHGNTEVTLEGTATGIAQETHTFTTGLIASIPNDYGREAIYKDPLAWQLYAHALNPPAAGDSAAGKRGVWKVIEADSLNRFRVRGGGTQGGFGQGGGYLYLTYTADKPRPALLHITGDGGLFFNGVPHAGDPYASGWLYIPVDLKKGLNELYIRVSGPVTASLVFPKQAVQLNTEDPTMPVISAGASGNDSLQGAVVVINATAKPINGSRLVASSGGREYATAVPPIPPMSTRKVSFWFDGAAVPAGGRADCVLTLQQGDKPLDAKTLSLEAVEPGVPYSITFTSDIDGSLQYYAVTPQARFMDMGLKNLPPDIPSPDAPPPGTVFAAGTAPGQTGAANPGRPGGSALFLSVHGAGVEAIGQARAYRSKNWGTLVAATNRRPRGFNWEDWGREDAMEVLSLAEQRFSPDPARIYLTGHSMGGHGTWFLGATYPDRWAAIGACSGYPTLKDYGSHDGVVPDSAQSPVEQLLLRASNQSDVIKLATNYKPMGVYILHGDADKVVPVKYARQMRKVLADFHTDMSYHEVPGAEHWYGNQSVDWDPLFDFFKWHTRKPDSLVNEIDFMTASPGISDAYYWASIQQQERPLDYSRMQLARNTKTNGITGTTSNIRLLRFALSDFAAHTTIKITLDGSAPVTYTTQGTADTLYLVRDRGVWTTAAKPDPWQKNAQRYGTLKDAFGHHMVFVYGTTGTEAENKWSIDKARYDAETWYYRGNGAVDVVADRAFSADAYAGRGIILYGNASTNGAWKLLLRDCPIQVERGRVSLGDRVWTGDSLGAYFVWPSHQSPVASVAVISGSGLPGMQAANANQ